MDAETMATMRKAAALAFAVPGLEVDISAGDALVARVQRRSECSTPARGVTSAREVTLLAPCAFRAAVGRLVLDGNGSRARFLDVHPDAALRIDYFMPFTGAARSFGRIVSRFGETVIHVFATHRPVADVLHVIAGVRGHPSLPRDVVVNCSSDELTRVTLVYCETRVGDIAAARPFIESIMDAVFVRLAVDEVTDAVAAMAS